MNLKNRPPIFVPQQYRQEIEACSKAALMDVAWDLAVRCAGSVNDADAIGDLVDAERAAGERVDDADARRVAEETEGIGERVDGGLVAKPRGG